MGKRRGMAYTVIAAVAAAAVIGAGAAGAAHAQEGERIPAWVKSVFAFYVNDEIAEAELINALEYLIDQNIIQVTQAAPAEPATDRAEKPRCVLTATAEHDERAAEAEAALVGRFPTGAEFMAAAEAWTAAAEACTLAGGGERAAAAFEKAAEAHN